jgi:hypothetical protein
VEARSLAVRLNDSVLAFFQDAGLQLHMPGFIDAVDVAERGREQVSANLAEGRPRAAVKQFVVQLAFEMMWCWEGSYFSWWRRPSQRLFGYLRRRHCAPTEMLRPSS